MMPRKVKNIKIKYRDDTYGGIFDDVSIYIDDKGIRIYEGAKEYFYNMTYVWTYEIENID